MGCEHPDWLPVDWKVRVKTRSSGRKDKYYIHPSTGLNLSSKPEVLRYLKTSEDMSKLAKINKVGMKKTVAEELPPGWIKEIRVKKTGGKTRRDPYYTDPVSGRQFRSMQEVSRYLKSKDLGEVKSKSDDKGRTSMKLVDRSQSSSAEARGERRSVGKKGDKNMTDGESIKSGPNASLQNIEKPLVKDSYRGDDSVTKKLQDKLPQAKGEEQQSGGRRSSKRLANNKLKHDLKDNTLQSGSKIVAENDMNILPDTNGSEQRVQENGCKNGCKEDSEQLEDPAGTACPKKRISTKRKWMNDLPRRTSRRLAHLEADQSVEVKTIKLGGASARLSADHSVEAKNSKRNGASAQLTADQSAEVKTSKKGGASARLSADQSVEVMTSKRDVDSAQMLADQSVGVKTRKRAGALARLSANQSVEVKTNKRDGGKAELSTDQSVEVKTSKRDGASAQLSVEVKTSEGDGASAQLLVEVKTSKMGGASAQLSSKGEVDSTKTSSSVGQSDEPEKDTSIKFGTTGSDEQCKVENPANDDQKESMCRENLSPEEPKSTGAVVHREDQEDDKHVYSLKDLFMDPCIEFAIKTLTGAIPIEDANKLDGTSVSSLASSNQTSGCSSLSPSGDLWSDPCFEFAVKTLTGEMPREDGSQISFEKPASSSAGSGSLPKPKV